MGTNTTVPVAATVLGPVGVRRDGLDLDLGTPKQRALVAGLALHLGRPVSADAIVDLLWGNTPSPGVTTTLQAYVSQLRRILEPGRERRAPARVLVTVGQGYALMLGPDELDAARFEAAVTEQHRRLRPLGLLGRGPLTAGELERSRAGLDAALALWRGEPYAELADAAGAVAERGRLNELRVVALEDRAVAELALGHHSTAAAELEALTHEHPLRERLWALRAVALTRAGRQAEALDVLRRVREVLDEELGLEPSAELRDLQTAVLRQDPRLDWVEPPTERAAVIPAPRAAPEQPPPDRATPPVAPWPLVGRDDQLGSLVEALERAEAGTTTYAVVTGEPGIGKSRLGAELAARARGRGARVLAGRASQDDGAPPLWPWKSVLSGLDDRLPQEQGDDIGSAFRVWERLCDRVVAAARERTTVVLLDDLHWADDSTLRVLRLLAETAPSTRLLVVAFWRRHPEPIGALADVAEALARAHAVRLDLTGLPPGQAADVVAAVAGQQVSPEQARALHERTDGNPFFLVEYARLAAERDDLAGLLASDHTPTAVTEVLNRRLARLAEDTVGVLRTAALLGREFDVPVLAAATGRHADEVLDLVEPAQEAGLVREYGIDRFVFAHALVRDTLRAGMSASRRARSHARLAQVLSGLPGHETAVAWHWAAAGPSYADRAWRAAVDAARIARRLHAYVEAAELLRSALASIELDPRSTLQDRYDALMGLIGCYRWAALLPQLIECAEKAIDVGKAMRDPVAVARASFAATQNVFWRSAPPGQVNEKVVGALRGTLDRLPPGDSDVRCGALLALANELSDTVPLAERRSLIQEGMAMAKRLGNQRLVMGAGLVAQSALSTPADLPQRHEWVRRAVEIGETSRTDRVLVVARTMLAVVLNELGRPAEMADAIARAREVAERSRILFGLLVLGELEVPWLAMAGRLEEAEERLATMRVTARRISHPHVEEALLSSTLALRLWQGRALEMAPLLERLDESPYPFAASVAVYLWRAGERDRARAYHARHGAPLDHENDVSLIAWCHAAELALYLEEPELGARVVARLAPYAGLSCCAGSALTLGPVDAYLALGSAAAGNPAAARHADDAAALARDWGLHRFGEWLAGTRAEYAF